MRLDKCRIVVILLFVCAAAISVPAAAEKIVIGFAGRYPLSMLQAEAWKQAMATYVKENPDVEIEYLLPESSTSIYMEKLFVAAAAGTFPDVVHIFNPWVPDFVDKRLLDPIPAALLDKVKRDLHPQSLIGAEYQGKQYGLPTQFMVSGLMYNKTLLAEAGVKEIPDTWETLGNLVKRLVGAQPPERKIGGMAFNREGWGWTGTWFALTKAYGAAYVNAAGQVTLNNAIGSKVMNMLVEWFAKDKWANTDTSSFLKGNTYFGFAYPFWIPNLETAIGPTYVDQIGLTRSPAGPNGIGNYQYSWGMYVSNTSKNKAEAWKFVDWLYMASRPQFQDLTLMGYYQYLLGSLPANLREHGSRVFAKNAAILNGFNENLPYAITEAKLPLADLRQTTLAKEVEAAIALKKTPQQALADMEASIKALLAEAQKR